MYAHCVIKMGDPLSKTAGDIGDDVQKEQASRENRREEDDELKEKKFEFGKNMMFMNNELDFQKHAFDQDLANQNAQSRQNFGQGINSKDADTAVQFGRQGLQQQLLGEIFGNYDAANNNGYNLAGRYAHQGQGAVDRYGPGGADNPFIPGGPKQQMAQNATGNPNQNSQGLLQGTQGPMHHSDARQRTDLEKKTDNSTLFDRLGQFGTTRFNELALDGERPGVSRLIGRQMTGTGLIRDQNNGQKLQGLVGAPPNSGRIHLSGQEDFAQDNIQRARNRTTTVTDDSLTTANTVLSDGQIGQVRTNSGDIYRAAAGMQVLAGRGLPGASNYGQFN